MAKLLITGGAGFIGSHTCLVLLREGHRLVVWDNFSNSSATSLERIKELAGPNAAGHITVLEGDIRKTEHISRAFDSSYSPIDAVIHFAGLKSICESIQQPLSYWDVNVNGSRSLLEAMQANGCYTLIFSSSATIYGYPKSIPIKETASISPINPYGHTKAAVEQMLFDLQASNPEAWRIACLRYFNPVGSHPSGRLGENPQGIPNNLFPYINQVAFGRRTGFQVFGGDWPTSDGSGVRDFIHVMDLAEAHFTTLNYLLAEAPQLLTFNLGSGQGHSVLEVIRAMETASGRSIPFTITDRRPGDAAISVADSSKAAKQLGWRTKRNIEEICRDSWKWQMENPNGYV